MSTATAAPALSNLSSDNKQQIISEVLKELRKGDSTASRRSVSQVSSFEKGSEETQERKIKLRVAFGKRIVSLREGLQISSAELGRRAGLAQAYTWHVENGMKEVSFDTAWRLAHALGVGISDLFAGCDEVK